MNFHAKGGAFERKFAKELSLWWTEGADAFVFSRRSALGGAGRDKSGHSGQSRDLQADKPVGELFLRFVSIELKSYNTLSGGMGKWLTGMGTGNTLIDRFWFQCCEDGEVTGRSPVLVLKANNRQSLVICSSGCVLYMIAYERWKAQAMENRLDRKLALPLGYSKGLSAEFTQAHGQAIVDLVDGVFSFEVSGLSDKDAFDVWFVDNRPGPRHSVKPEPGMDW